MLSPQVSFQKFWGKGEVSSENVEGYGIDRQTDRQTDRLTDRQTDRQTESTRQQNQHTEQPRILSRSLSI